MNRRIFREGLPVAGVAAVVLWLSPAARLAGQQVPWAVKDAPVRVVVKPDTAPAIADAGTKLDVPDLGLVKSGGGDYALTDAAGKAVPVAAVWQGEGRDTFLLARDLRAGESYYLYVGGAKGATWSPKTSLLLETRRSAATRTEGYGSSGAITSAWNGAAAQAQGAEFVPSIFGADNPFGEQTNYLAHYSGYLAPTSSDMELFSNSSDPSFIFVNDGPFIDWTGRGLGNTQDKTLRAKKLPASSAPVKVDYYCAKAGGDEPAGRSMGWRRPGGHVEIIPPEAFLHPGTAKVERYEAQAGGPVPVPTVRFKSYLGFGGTYLFEAQCGMGPADLAGATVEWRFEDGAVFTGTEFTRVMAGVPGSQRVTVTARRGASTMQVTRRISFFGKPPPEASEGREEGKNSRGGHERYCDLLTQLDPPKLAPYMLAATLPLLFDSGTDAQAAAFANPWLAKADTRDALWLPAYSAHVRTVAQTNPKAAVAEVRANTVARSLYSQQLNLLELELLVFSVHDLANLPQVQQLTFNLPPNLARLRDVRIGDLYRLNGQVDQAVASYRAAQPPDASNGRQLPAEDQANSMTVENLLANGTRQEAMDKLTDWELAHPMCKFTTNFLVLRVRTLARYGRWREALTELEAFPATHPDSPYEIDVNYYRARALYELGSKDEARKLWRDLAKQYPRSELAKPSLEWADKP